jgi:ABC-type multidrug transport system fused ATPase/permease subunit
LLGAGIALPLATHRLARRRADRLVDDRARLQAALADELAGAAELIAYDAPTGFEDRIGAASAGLGAGEAGLARLRAAGDALGSALAGGTALAVLVVAIPLVSAGRIEGVLLAVTPLVVLAAFEGVAPLAGAMEQRHASRAAARRVFAVADAAPPVPEPTVAEPAPVGRDVELRDVAYRYPGGEAPVLRGLSFALPEGGRLAIVGPSGSGKSTIVGLLARFLEPDAGWLGIGGVDVRCRPGDDTRALVGIVPQHPYLFHGTIRDNLLVARGEATDDEIRAALEIASLERFVAGLPRALDTMVGDDGVRLSGGERQRLAIARVVLADAPIVVLDEATSHLDARTEIAVAAALDGYLRGRTAIVLGHRSRILGLADRRLALDTA